MVWREDKTWAANLLRQSLRDSAEPCPGPEVLAAYFDRSLDASETARFELHLSECSICREHLAAIDRADQAVSGDRAGPHPSSPRAWLWDWRWLAPATAALIIAGVWMARRPPPKTGAQQQPLVAMSQPTAAPNALPAVKQEPGGRGPTTTTERREYAHKASARPESAGPPPEPTANEARDLAIGAKTSPSNLAPSAPAQDQELARNRVSSEGAQHTDALEKKDKDLDNRAALSSSPASGMVSGNAGAPASPARPPTTANRAERDIAGDPATEAVEPQSGGVGMESRQAPAHVLDQRIEPSSQGRSSAVAIQAVERRSVQMIRTPDPKVLWRIAEGGFAERSTDGGRSWSGRLLDSDAQLTAGFAPSVEVCWVVGRNGAVFLTTHESDWRRIQPPINADFTAVTAQDAFSATITSADGRRFVTTDGGNHWSSAR